MTLKHIMAILVVSLMFACIGTATVAQPTPLSSTAPSSLIGKWNGTWAREARDGRPSAGGPMEMEIETDEGDRIAGRVRFPDARNCSAAWEKLEGTRSGDKISARYDIGGRCGKATLTLSVDLVRGVIVGRYSSEGAGDGDIRLKRE